MTYATILVHVHSGPAGAGALRCAASLAGRMDATLVGIGVQAVPPPPFTDPTGALAGDWVVAMRETVEGNVKDAHRLFRDAAARLSKPAIWETGLQMPGPAVARASRCADLIVVGLPAAGHDDIYSTARPGDLAIEAGRPVLIVPDGAAPLEGRRIVLAWKDSREARRAMSDGIPLFKRADEVLVLEVCDPDDAEGAKTRTDDVAAALGRHGVKAQAKVVAHEPADGHQILRQASLIGADLIVAGAYGHTRLGEWIFGGVTRDLLAHTDRYLLFSH